MAKTVTATAIESPRLTLLQFVKRHRTELDYFISQHPDCGPIIDDQARGRWVRRDQGLASWAEEEGVRL